MLFFSVREQDFKIQSSIVYVTLSSFISYSNACNGHRAKAENTSILTNMGRTFPYEEYYHCFLGWYMLGKPKESWGREWTGIDRKLIMAVISYSTDTLICPIIPSSPWKFEFSTIYIIPQTILLTHVPSETRGMSSSRCFFDIVDIAMKSPYRHRVDIGTLSYLVYIVYIVDIAMLTNRIDIVSTSVPCHPLPVIPRLHRSHRRHRDVDDIVSTSCRHRYPLILCLHRRHREIKVYNCFIKSAKILHDIGFNHNKCPWRCPPQLKVGAKWCAYVVTSQEYAHKTRRSKQNVMRKPVF